MFSIINNQGWRLDLVTQTKEEKRSTVHKPSSAPEPELTHRAPHDHIAQQKTKNPEVIRRTNQRKISQPGRGKIEKGDHMIERQDAVMHARVAELARAFRRRSSPAAVPLPTNAEIIVAPVAGQAGQLGQPGESGHQSPSIEVAGVATLSDVPAGPSAILSTGAIAAIEIASSGSKDVSGEGKRPSKGKSSSKSSKPAERRAAKDAAEEEENTRQFKDQVTWWKQAREDLKTRAAGSLKWRGETES
ncbi:hypothetical protein Salat_0696300 [Sesamum alatum]|uniref:Uncharacterized protein n=1 Tax=Sesamum alatum TaxID=300844 RepID=A0AAE1YRS4_9LAMI|nr:hypothetical protein Salat_0696300 [Sesamum alatum]